MSSENQFELYTEFLVERQDRHPDNRPFDNPIIVHGELSGFNVATADIALSEIHRVLDLWNSKVYMGPLLVLARCSVKQNGTQTEAPAHFIEDIVRRIDPPSRFNFTKFSKYNQVKMLHELMR